MKQKKTCGQRELLFKRKRGTRWQKKVVKRLTNLKEQGWYSRKEKNVLKEKEVHITTSIVSNPFNIRVV